MANSIQTFAQNLVMEPSFRPQTLSSTGAGVAVAIDDLGTNYLSANLSVGAVSALSSLVVKVQCATDSAFTTPVDIVDAVFPTVTTANQDLLIDFQLPPAANINAASYTHVRLYATLTGTNAAISGHILGWKRKDAGDGFENTAPVLN